MDRWDDIDVGERFAADHAGRLVLRVSSRGREVVCERRDGSLSPISSIDQTRLLHTWLLRLEGEAAQRKDTTSLREIRRYKNSARMKGIWREMQCYLERVDVT